MSIIMKQGSDQGCLPDISKSLFIVDSPAKEVAVQE